MPVPKKKPTTLTPEGSTSEPSLPALRLAGRNFVSIYIALP